MNPPAVDPFTPCGAAADDRVFMALREGQCAGHAPEESRVRAPLKINACLAGAPGGHAYVLYVLDGHTVGITLTRDEARRLAADLLAWSDGELRSEISKAGQLGCPDPSEGSTR